MKSGDAVKILVTGGSGFIGSAVCRLLVTEEKTAVVNVDKLTYAAVPGALDSVSINPLYAFEQVDICERDAIAAVFQKHKPTGVIHLAAESHVDRSIDGPSVFVQTNVVGTCTLLDATLQYWQELSALEKERFRFHHVSTDEVYGSLGDEGLFTEDTRYEPNSPYSASKAASDHFVRAWNQTYGLPVVTSNCSNNYGPYQFTEKLVPLMVLNVLFGAPLPVYGDGKNVRDWLHVEDHAKALALIFRKGRTGEGYNVGGNNEVTNIEIVNKICELVEAARPDIPVRPARSLISYVTDRPGHDQRYAIDSTKIQNELGWTPAYDLDTGLAQTVQWYLDNEPWWRAIRDDNYQGERLGLRKP